MKNIIWLLLLVLFLIVGCDKREKDYFYTVPDPNWKLVSNAGNYTPEGRFGFSIICTGSKIIIWGGANDDDLCLNSGGILDCETLEWSETSRADNCPSPRASHSAIWTGNEMIIWGGTSYPSNHSDGAKYNPATNEWAPMNSSNCPVLPRGAHSAVWTGAKMIVWGGVLSIGMPPEFTNTGGIYDPVKDTWSETSTGNGCPSARDSHKACWTGEKMIIFGGTPEFKNGAAYDPVSDSWEPYNTDPPSPYPKYAVDTVFDTLLSKQKGVIWGGTLGYQVVNNGAIYDFADNTWSLTSTDSNCPSPRTANSSVWTGSKLIIWGGYDYVATVGEVFLNDGGIYDSETDTWQSIPGGYGVPKPRYQHSAIWIGNAMFIWGGYDKNGNLLNTGGIYTPPAP
jgi:N-acetylneuraminic acid mutarotase